MSGDGVRIEDINRVSPAEALEAYRALHADDGQPLPAWTSTLSAAEAMGYYDAIIQGDIAVATGIERAARARLREEALRVLKGGNE